VPARNLQLSLVAFQLATTKHLFLIDYDMITEMKRIFRRLLILLVMVLLAVGVRYFVKKQTRRRREASYQSTLYLYSQVLKPGITRKEVEDYLRAKKLEFRQMCCAHNKEFRKIPWDDLVKIGEERCMVLQLN
jgi:hypothetical protein